MEFRRVLFRSNDPDMKPKLQQFVTASIKASRFIMDHPDQAVQILEKKYPDLDKGHVADIIHSLNDDKDRGINGGMSEQQVADYLEILNENGMLPKNIKPRADVFDSHFIEPTLKQMERKKR